MIILVLRGLSLLPHPMLMILNQTSPQGLVSDPQFVFFFLLSDFSLERIHQDPKCLLNFSVIQDVAGGVGCAEVGALQTLPAC